MCEIICTFMAVVFSAVYFVLRKSGKRSSAVTGTMITFWGASLCWLVDCVVSVMEGEPFFDMSMSDTILGFIIAGFGLGVYAVLLVREKLVASKQSK